jgi:hypothetical protein
LASRNWRFDSQPLDDLRGFFVFQTDHSLVALADMARRPFYEIAKENYLFPSKSRPDGDRNTPEELVRQWCLFELMRAYGISISDIEFERPVRVGSKNYRIDILVLQDGKPWIVIECKEQNHAKHDDGMAQAVSYAKAQEIQAQFAVYTNGHTWLVQRYYREQWLPVPDIPITVGEQAQQPIGQLLQTLHEVAPLLYILHNPLAGKDAKRLFDKMQLFFHGWNSLTWESGDKNLHFGVELLLRVLSVGKDDAHYCHSKLEGARASFEKFRQRAGFPFEIFPLEPSHVLEARVRDLYNALSNMIEGSRDLQVYDSYLLRLCVALLEYTLVWANSKEPYPQVGTNIHIALKDYLSYSLAIRMNTELPDNLDKGSMGDMKSYCQFAWDADEEEI